MKNYNIIIAYDIADIRRLKKIAKLLEKEAFRIQFSIFFLPNITEKQINILISKILKIINKKKDDVRIYKVNIEKSISLQNAVDLKYPTLFL